MTTRLNNMPLARAVRQALGDVDRRGDVALGVIPNPDTCTVHVHWGAQLGERAGIDSTTSTTGAPFSFKTGGPFAPILQPVYGALQYARFINVPQNGQLGVPAQQAADIAATWVAENPGSPRTPTELTTALISAQRRTVAIDMELSRQFVNSASDNYSGQDELLSLMKGALATAIGTAAINGSGSGNNQPTGLLGNTSVPTVAIDTDGGPLTVTHCALLEEQIGLANAEADASLAFHTTPQVRRKARLTEQFTGAGPLWTNQNTLIGYPAFASTNTPSTLTKGTSSGVCSAVVFGRWQDLFILTFGSGFDIVIDPYSKKRQAMIGMSVLAYVDVLVPRPTSFAKIVDATT